MPNGDAKAQPVEKINENNIGSYEKETIEAASRAITILEGALAKWDSLKEKPDDCKEEFDNFRSFHKELMDWEQRILRSIAKEEQLSFDSRLERLREYARICRAHG